MNENVLRSCRTCQKTGEELVRCGKCKTTFYCNQECQKIDWVSHRSYCKERNPEEERKKKQMGMGQFHNMKHIGSGNFSIIFRAQSKKDGKTYAIKQIEKAKVKRIRKEEDVFMEKHCLKRLFDCPYVVQLFNTFQDQMNLYFKMQCPPNGQLWQKSKNFGIIEQSIFKYYASHVVKGLSLLHNEYGIVHRDLKPQNILLGPENQIKLIDFGTAKDLTHPQIKGSGNGLKGKKPFQHYVGTPNYMAPQCIHNRASEKKSDIYSLSGVFYFLKVGSPPFAGGSEYLVYTKSLETTIPTYPQIFSQTLQDLMKKMNTKQMSERYDINDVMEHSYFKGVDFDNLPTFIEAESLITEEQKGLREVVTELEKLLEEKIDHEKVEQRRTLYNQKIKPYLEGLKSSENDLVLKRLKVLEIQCQVYLNLQDNTNVGIAQTYVESA